VSTNGRTDGIGNPSSGRFGRGGHGDSTGGRGVVKKTESRGKDLLGRATSLGGGIRSHQQAVTSSGAEAAIAR